MLGILYAMYKKFFLYVFKLKKKMNIKLFWLKFQDVWICK